MRNPKRRRLAGAGIVGAFLLVSSFRCTEAGAGGFGPPALISPSILNSDRGDDIDPAIVSDGHGRWVAVWSSSRVPRNEPGDKLEILVSRSSDDAATWTAPEVLSGDSDTDSANHFSPSVSTDGLGTWVAVWSSTRILVSRSTDNGATWTYPAPLIDSVSGASPQVATDGDGTWVASWISSGIRVSRSFDDGVTWSTPILLSPSASFLSHYGHHAHLATDRTGIWVAVWNSGTRSGNLTSFSSDNGATWSVPAELDPDAAVDSRDDYSAGVTTDGLGSWVAVWSSKSFDSFEHYGDDLDLFFVRSTDGGRTWSAPEALHSNARRDSGNDSDAALAVDGNGDWIAVWTSTTRFDGTGRGDEDILFALSSDGGATWSDATPLNANAGADEGDDTSPVVAANASGHWVAAWTSTDGLGGRLGSDPDILFAVSTSGRRMWPEPAPLHSNAAEDPGGVFPHLATDGRGTSIAIWYEQRSDAGVFAVVARSDDNGVTWHTPIRLGRAGDYSAWGSPLTQIATDGKGTWIALWTAYHDYDPVLKTSDADIMVSRSGDNGRTWTAPAPVDTSGSGEANWDDYPSLATDRVGNWLAAWTSSQPEPANNAIPDVEALVSRSTDNGRTWTAPSAIDPNAASPFQRNRDVRVATNGSGRWISVWKNSGVHFIPFAGGYWEDSGGEVMAAVSDDGGATWSAPIDLDPEGSDYQYAPDVMGDGAGNWIVAWNSWGILGRDWDIFFVRSIDQGNTWSAPAALNSNAATDSGNDVIPRLVADGRGNWMATWASSNDLDGSDDADILMSTSTDAGQTWTSPLPLNSNATDDTGDDYEAQVASDGEGHWIAVWYSYDPFGELGGLSGSHHRVAFATGGLCGDGLLVAPENCEHGSEGTETCCSDTCSAQNVGSSCFSLDICTEHVCSDRGRCGVAAPMDASDCYLAAHSSLQLTDPTGPGIPGLQWNWRHGEDFPESVLGAPEVDTAYTLCVYDMEASQPRDAASLEVQSSATRWKSGKGNGLRYRDPSGSSDGIRSLTLKAGRRGQSSIQLSGAGDALPLPGPAGSAYFDQDPSVLVQLRNSSGACWSSEFPRSLTSVNQQERFRAVDE